MTYQTNNNKFRVTGSTYSYLKDPHLFYHLESPNKVKILLDSGLYQLNGNILTQLQTKQKLQLSEYTIDKIPETIKLKYDKQLVKQRERKILQILEEQTSANNKKAQKNNENQKQDKQEKGEKNNDKSDEKQKLKDNCNNNNQHKNNTSQKDGNNIQKRQQTKQVNLIKDTSSLNINIIYGRVERQKVTGNYSLVSSLKSTNKTSTVCSPYKHSQIKENKSMLISKTKEQEISKNKNGNRHGGREMNLKISNIVEKKNGMPAINKNTQSANRDNANKKIL